MTTTMALLGKRAETGVLLAGATLRATGEHGERERLEVADDGDERESERTGSGEEEQHRGPSARAASPQRTGREASRGKTANHATHRGADRLADPAEDQSGKNGCDCAGDHRSGERPPERSRGRKPERCAGAGAQTDAIRLPHRAAESSYRPFRHAPRGNNSCVNDAPMLVFFYSERSGPARRMESLLAHVERVHRERLRVRRVDADRHPHLVRKFCVERVPSLALVRGKTVVDRIDGRASMPQIERLLEPHLPVLELA